MNTSTSTERLLIAVLGCEARKERMAAQRATWAKDFAGLADVRFFLARQEREPLADEVYLDALDDYNSLPSKCRAMVRWALDAGYQRVLKTDDDSVIFRRKLRVPKEAYVGWVIGRPTINYASGLAYWLDRGAMEIVALAQLDPAWPVEDRWVASELRKAGIEPVDDGGVLFMNRHQRPLPADIYRRMAPGYAVGEFTPAEIPFIYAYAG
jgi:hypothetical protein